MPEIALARPADCEALSEFLARAVPSAWRVTALPNAAQCQRAVTSQHNLTALAREQGIIVGLASGWVLPSVTGVGDTVMLDELLVVEARRGYGVGTALVAAFVRMARQTAEPPIQIWATTQYPEEPAAIPFVRAGAQSTDILRQYEWPLENQA